MSALEHRKTFLCQKKNGGKTQTPLLAGQNKERQYLAPERSNEGSVPQAPAESCFQPQAGDSFSKARDRFFFFPFILFPPLPPSLPSSFPLCDPPSVAERKKKITF